MAASSPPSPESPPLLPAAALCPSPPAPRKRKIPFPFFRRAKLACDGDGRASLACPEALLRGLGLWDFARLSFGVRFRPDLVAALVANYEPASCRSLVCGIHFALSRAALARALALPTRPLSDGEIDAEAFSGPEVVAAVTQFVKDRILLWPQDDGPVMLAAGEAALRLVEEGKAYEVDWAGLLWSLVESELLDASGTGQCYYALHLQCLMKCQCPWLFEEEEGAGPELNREDDGSMDITPKDGAEETRREESFLPVATERIADFFLQRCLFSEIVVVDCEDLGSKGKEGMANMERGSDGYATGLSPVNKVTPMVCFEATVADNVSWSDSRSEEFSVARTSETNRLDWVCESNDSWYASNVNGMEFVEISDSEDDKTASSGGLSDDTNGISVFNPLDQNNKMQHVGLAGHESNGLWFASNAYEMEFVENCDQDNKHASSGGLSDANGISVSNDVDQTNKMHHVRLSGHESNALLFVSNINGMGSVKICDDKDNKHVGCDGLCDHQNNEMHGIGLSDHESQDFNVCMVEIETLMCGIEMKCLDRQQAYNDVRSEIQCLKELVEKKNRLIESLEKAMAEERRKRQAVTRRYENELKLMSRAVSGYKRSLKDTKRAFAEYKRQITAGGLAQRKLEPNKLHLAEKHELHLVAAEMINDFQKVWCLKFVGYAEWCTELARKLAELKGKIQNLQGNLEDSETNL